MSIYKSKTKAARESKRRGFKGRKIFGRRKVYSTRSVPPSKGRIASEDSFPPVFVTLELDKKCLYAEELTFSISEIDSIDIRWQDSEKTYAHVVITTLSKKREPRGRILPKLDYHEIGFVNKNNMQNIVEELQKYNVTVVETQYFPNKI